MNLIVNAAKRAAKYPGKFELPSKKALSTLNVGDCVKLIFEFTPQRGREDGCIGERMWVEITHILSTRTFAGELANKPSTPELRKILDIGDHVAFSIDDIIDIEKH